MSLKVLSLPGLSPNASWQKHLSIKLNVLFGDLYFDVVREPDFTFDFFFSKPNCLEGCKGVEGFGSSVSVILA